MNRTVAGALARIALLYLCTSCGLLAGTITYTLVESLPRFSPGDQPTATWVATTSGYINGALTFSGTPTFNAAAVSDGYAYITGNPLLHNAPGTPYYLLTGIDLSAVEMSVNSGFGFGTYDPCTDPQSGTACNITKTAAYSFSLRDGLVSGFGPDSLTVTDTSVPEPGTATLAAGGCFILCSLLWFGQRARKNQPAKRRS